MDLSLHGLRDWIGGTLQGLLIRVKLTSALAVQNAVAANVTKARRAGRRQSARLRRFELIWSDCAGSLREARTPCAGL
jgi:hypothetical protein